MAASNINSVTLTGNLTKDPEVRETSAGTSVAELRLAVNNARKTADGTWESQANYFQVNVWGKQAENCEKYLKKGSKVGIQGRLEWQKWENKEGETNSRVVVVAQTVEFLGPKTEGSAASEDGPDF